MFQMNQLALLICHGHMNYRLYTLIGLKTDLSRDDFC
jgi:hypothetical protein